MSHLYGSSAGKSPTETMKIKQNIFIKEDTGRQSNNSSQISSKNLTFFDLIFVNLKF